MLTITNVEKKNILSNINLQVEKGSIAVLVGPSGCGKSTLLRIICGLDKEYSGSVSYENSSDFFPGMVFQEYFLFEHLSTLKNITLVLPKGTKDPEKVALALLEKYELGSYKDSLAKHLSGGQKQRLAIARSIAADPKVLCMDEPTSALDKERTEKVANTIKELAESGMTVVVTTHDPSLIKLLPCKVYKINEGKLSIC